MNLSYLNKNISSISNLLPLPNISNFKYKDAQAKVEWVKRLHEQVKAQLAKKNESYAKQANKN